MADDLDAIFDEAHGNITENSGPDLDAIFDQAHGNTAQDDSSFMDWMLTRPSGERISAGQATLGPVLNTLNAMTGNYGDEIMGAGGAAIDTAGDAVRELLGYPQQYGDSFSENYESRKAQANAIRNDFRKAAPGGALITDIAGISKVPLPSKISERTTILGKAGQAALEGAGYGALYSSGEGDGLLDRLARAYEGGESGAKWGGGLGAIGGVVEKTAGALGRGSAKAASQLELSAYGVNKTQARKAIEQNFRGLVDDGGMIENPMSAAISSFRAMAGNAGRTSDPSELVNELKRQQTSLSDELGAIIGEAQAKQAGTITPSFQKTIDFVSELPGTEKAAGTKLANELISDTLSSIDPSRISTIHQEKVRLGRIISDAAWGKDKSAVETNIKKRIYADLKDAVEAGYQRITGSDANVVKEINQEIGMRIGLQKSFSDMLATDHTQDIFKAGIAAARTSGGFGVPAQILGTSSGVASGAIVGGPLGAAIGGAGALTTIGAGHLAQTPGGRRVIADILRSAPVRGGFEIGRDLGSSVSLQAPRVGGLVSRDQYRAGNQSARGFVPGRTTEQYNQRQTQQTRSTQRGSESKYSPELLPPKESKEQTYRETNSYPSYRPTSGAPINEDNIDFMLRGVYDAPNSGKGAQAFTDLFQDNTMRMTEDNAAAVLDAVRHVESNDGDPRFLRSNKGARGPYQFLPATAKELGVDPTDGDESDDRMGAYRMLSRLQNRFGSLELALAAYNWGEGNLAQAIKRAGSSDWEVVRDFVPKETFRYVPAVLSRMSGGLEV
jgi:hypothetical protein